MSYEGFIKAHTGQIGGGYRADEWQHASPLPWLQGLFETTGAS